MTNPDGPIVQSRYPVSCCCPLGERLSALFWGATLLVLGGVWLGANLVGYQDWSKWLVPALVAAWGAALLLGSRANQSRPR